MADVTIFRTEDGRSFDYEWEAQSHANDLAKEAVERAVKDEIKRQLAAEAKKHFYEADRLLKDENIDGAIAEYTAGIDHARANGVFGLIDGGYACNQRGICYLNKGKYSDAVNDFTEAFNQYYYSGNRKDAAECRYNRGLAYARSGNMDAASFDWKYGADRGVQGAINSLAQAGINYTIQTHNDYNNKGVDYYKEGNYKVAIGNFYEAVDLIEFWGGSNYIHYIYHRNIGDTYLKQKNREYAKDSYTRAYNIKGKTSLFDPIKYLSTRKASLSVHGAYLAGIPGSFILSVVSALFAGIVFFVLAGNILTFTVITSLIGIAGLILGYIAWRTNNFYLKCPIAIAILLTIGFIVFGNFLNDADSKAMQEAVSSGNVTTVRVEYSGGHDIYAEASFSSEKLLKVKNLTKLTVTGEPVTGTSSSLIWFPVEHNGVKGFISERAVRVLKK